MPYSMLVGKKKMHFKEPMPTLQARVGGDIAFNSSYASGFYLVAEEVSLSNKFRCLGKLLYKSTKSEDQMTRNLGSLSSSQCNVFMTMM